MPRGARDPTLQQWPVTSRLSSSTWSFHYFQSCLVQLLQRIPISRYNLAQINVMMLAATRFAPRSVSIFRRAVSTLSNNSHIVRYLLHHILMPNSKCSSNTKTRKSLTIRQHRHPTFSRISTRTRHPRNLQLEHPPPSHPRRELSKRTASSSTYSTKSSQNMATRTRT